MSHSTRWDFFYRTENSRRNPKDGEVYSVSWSFPAGTSLAFALKWMRDEGKLGQGSQRAGCFEVQTPEGIWSHVTESKIDLSTPAKAKKVIFKTWDQLDDE